MLTARTASNTRQPGVLAVGAWLKNRACLWTPTGTRWSALHGDLSDPAACEALDESLQTLLSPQGVELLAVAHDLHPDFFSTRQAQTLAHGKAVICLAVQHHHAHIAAVMAEHHLHRPVIGIAWDGVGLGSDGSAWGGECLRVTPDGRFERLAHLSRLDMPGGDRAAREPWRLGCAVLSALGQGQCALDLFSAHAGSSRVDGVLGLLRSPQPMQHTTAAGRWFDAAAALLGLCWHQTDEAQAPIALERAATQWLNQQGIDTHGLLVRDALRPLVGRMVSPQVLNVLPLVEHLRVRFASGQASAAHLSAVFHSALAQALCEQVCLHTTPLAIDAVALGGGCFLNHLLTEHVTQTLTQRGLRVYRAVENSSGDAGIALGQAWVAAQQLGLAAAAGGRTQSPTAASAPIPILSC